MAKKKREQNIAFSTHPEYRDKFEDWVKFRLVMEGGRRFKDAYLFQRPNEPKDVYALRKKTATVPAFAKSAVRKIRNSIYQRLDGVRRSGGSDKYNKAVDGQLGGVDLQGSNMEFFMGHKVLPELLSMGKVGVFVDSPNLFGSRRTIRDNEKRHPYVYHYRAEDIRNWEFFMRDREWEFKKLLLRIRKERYDPFFNLVYDMDEEYRLFEVDDNGNVTAEFFNKAGHAITIDGEPLPYRQPAVLETDRIPFVLMELETSLLEDVADHQIALLNMESLDVNFVVRANAPYYVEQYDPVFEAAYNQGPSDFETADEDNLDGDGNVDASNPTQASLGGSDGRRYPKDLDQPGFIAPPSDPMRASMEKQQQLKDDIDRLLDLATLSTRSRYASAESKGFDERGLDSGLSAIGLVLEQGERGIGGLWTQYEPGTETIVVKYPERYSLKSDDDRRKDAKILSELEDKVPSATWRKNVRREMAETMFGAKISDEDLAAIFREVDESKFATSDIERLRADVEIGLVSRELASEARGWPKGEAAKAEEEREKRDAAKALNQGVNLSARGLSDDSQGAKDEKAESQDPDNNPDGVRKVRGEGQNPKGRSEQ